MKKLYISLFFLLFIFRLAAQDCSLLQFLSFPTESRCAATGFITVNAWGGSGNYNYSVTGPVVKPFTSSPVISGLSAGYYKVFVKDVSTNCVNSEDSVYVPGTYQDPRFQLAKVNASCAGNDGSISVINQQYGRGPFAYTVIAPSVANVGATNGTGSFSNLIPGEYYVQLRDSCGGIQVRRITIENYSWWFDSTSVTRAGCDSANAFIRVRDNRGNINTAGGFAGFQYGVTLSPGDTTWFATNSFRFYIGKKRYATLVVKDNCGNKHTFFWVLPPSLMPAVGSVAISNLGCTTFTATVTGQQNLTSPQYCLLNSNNDTISCNTTGIFNNLPYSNYCIKVRDNCYDTTITRCFTVTKPVPAVDANVGLSSFTCSTFTATITGGVNLINPQYCLYVDANDPIACNSTGVFTNVPYGSYCIQVINSCNDTVINRCFRAEKPRAVLTGVTLSGSTCTSFNIDVNNDSLINPTYCLYDSLGNVIVCNSTGIFDSIPQGTYCIKGISCGDTTAPVCFTSVVPIPSVGANVQISNKICTGFNATVTGQQNLSNPQYCLLNATNDTLQCNTTGVFTNIPYGSYCIKIKGGCRDTVITRCFTVDRAIPSVNAAMQLLSSNCTTVSIKINGTNLTSPTYCLYDSLNNQVACNTTGTFNNIPFGRYCVEVEDGCIDTTFRICQTFNFFNDITLNTSKNCIIGSANISVQFQSPNTPYNVKIYRPNGTLLSNTTSSSNPVWLVAPALPAGQTYKIVGTDNCGRYDSAFIAPDASIITKSASVNKKCPSATWLNGSGDIVATCTSNWYTVLPSIIKKNGAVFAQGYSAVTGNAYTFADLEPATYIVEYNMQNCNSKVYDTITVSPYTYPAQGQSAIYVCDNNSFSLGAVVNGGVSPYTYQIIGSTPAAPSINSTQVNNPVFAINNGTSYSLIRLRTIDQCGNATLADVSVLPLQNIAVNATDSCFYQDITLTVDSVPNSTYTWYRKTSPVDSILIGTGSGYNLPFFEPEDVGTYVCVISVNNGCLIRNVSFILDGDCGEIILANGLQLKGKSTTAGNQLTWTTRDERNIQLYEIEKKISGNVYNRVGTVQAQNSGGNSSYHYLDNNAGNGLAYYRIKKIHDNGRSEYSNIISLKFSHSLVNIYPNPVKNSLNISIASAETADYKIELLNTSAQTVFTKELKGIRTTTFTWNRNNQLNPGIYFIRITNTASGRTEVQKLILE